MIKKIIALITSLILVITSIVTIVNLPRTDEYLDLAYGTHERNRLDLYLPKRHDGELGLVLLIHGGAWISGDKAGYREQIEELAEDGYAAASMNYRYVSEDVDINDIVYEIELALKLIKQTGTDNGVNINKVLLRGYSAGGQLSMLYAYSKADSAPIKPVAVVSDAGGPADFSDVNFYLDNILFDPEGGAELISKACGKKFTVDTIDSAKEELLKISPITYINENSVPTQLNYGVKDEIIPYGHALRLQEKLTECGVRCDLVAFPDSGHGLDGDKNNRKKSENLFMEYCETYLK